MASDIDLHLITRREAILRVSALFGGIALVGQSAMLAGCSRQKAPGGAVFAENDVAFLDEVAETILPETSTPGAKAAGVGPFIALMVADTYSDREQQVFRDGMRTLDDECDEMHGASFMSATPAQRLALLEKLDAEQMHYMKTRADDAPAHYFRMMKELALLGYFSSEIGYKQAMRYVETPGRYEPCVPARRAGKRGRHTRDHCAMKPLILSLLCCGLSSQLSGECRTILGREPVKSG